MNKIIFTLLGIVGGIFSFILLFYSCSKDDSLALEGSSNGSVSAVTNNGGVSVVSYSDRIPKAYMISESDLPNLMVAKTYSEKLGGYLVVEGAVDKQTNQAKILSIDVVKSSNQTNGSNAFLEKDCSRSKSAQECMRCCTDKPTEAGVLLCTGYCIIDFITGTGGGKRIKIEDAITRVREN